jgi:23S rRNA pseudouridine2605 synthase
MGLLRLQKFLSEAGIASRRASEEIIQTGRVSVNGRVIKELGTRVDPLHDRVLVDGHQVKPKRKLYVALHKPRRFLCSRRGEGDQRLISELLPREWTELFPVGRLDYESEGLIFLTNDGDFCLKLTHPRYEVAKTYIVTLEGRVEEAVLEKARRGVWDRGEELKAHRTHLISASNKQSVVELELREGKNREVRRLFEAQGFLVKKLIRTKIGPIKLGELPSGKWRTLTEPEIKSLLPKI